MTAARRRHARTDDADPVEAFGKLLTDEDRMLIRLREELYDGHWDAMLADLNDRLHGRPYIFRLANRIQDDMARVRMLSRFEKEHKVNLAEIIWPEEYK